MKFVIFLQFLYPFGSIHFNFFKKKNHCLKQKYFVSKIIRETMKSIIVL